MADDIVRRSGIVSAIHSIRDLHVMLDADLAAMYGVETGNLVRAVKRNIERFPEDFMFQLTEEEFAALKSAGAGSRGGRRYPPYAFTEQGVAMLSSVLRSERAVAVNIEIMRAFVRLRGMLRSNDELGRRLDEMEAKYDSRFAVVFQVIQQLTAPADPGPKHPIGFQSPADD